jgi:cytochrome c-type biogenesis protein CcmH/NrfG
MSQQKYPKAYEAYQQAVYRDGRNPTFWCSIGVLYYQINQYRDALDAYSRAIRLNPNISEVWYDLGTLVCLSFVLVACISDNGTVRVLQQSDRRRARCLPASR